MHQIKISKRRYCRECGIIHRRGDLVLQCPYCEGHARDNQLYDLKSHGLTEDRKDKQQACRLCIEKFLGQENIKRFDDPVVNIWMGYDDY